MLPLGFSRTRWPSTLPRITDIVSVAFGKEGQRSIIAMSPADSVSKSMADRLKAFAADQSSVALPTAHRDVQRAQSIGALNAAVQAATAAAQIEEAQRAALRSEQAPAQQLAEDIVRKAGKVKFFNFDKGFGFVKDLDGNDYFFNANYVKGTEATTGAEVEFEPGRSERGPIAKNVRVVAVAA
jgi:cold shock CspA family protein